MTRSGDLLGACTPKGTATYPANNAWTAAYPANHVGLAPSLPGSSLPGSSVPGTEPTRQTAYPAAAYPADSLPGGSLPGRQPQHPSPTADLPGKSRRVCGVCPGLGAPGGPTRQITRPTRQVRISEGVLGQACKTCLTVGGSEHGEASGLC
jgi:hypothetical protein